MAIHQRKSNTPISRWCREDFWILKKQSQRLSFPTLHSKVWWKFNELWLQKRRGKETQEEIAVHDGSVLFTDDGKEFENSNGYSHGRTVQRLEIRKSESPFDRTYSRSWEVLWNGLSLFSLCIVGRRSLSLRRGQSPKPFSEIKNQFSRNWGHIYTIKGKS